MDNEQPEQLRSVDDTSSTNAEPKPDININESININSASGKTTVTGTKVVVSRTEAININKGVAKPVTLGSLLSQALLGLLCAYLINVASSNLPKDWQEYSWIALVLVAIITILTVVRGYRQSRETELELSIGGNDYSRSRIINKVEFSWIKSVLEQSLYQVAKIELRFEHDSEIVEHPWEVIVQHPKLPNKPIPSGTPIIEVFNELNNEMLILGGAGAGKTTVLLELTRTLIAQARANVEEPFPVVFNLASWAVQKGLIKDWLIQEFGRRYNTSPKLATYWIDNTRLILLLDGLDEMAEENRTACIDAINAFRKDYGLIPLVVCSRTVDYKVLKKKLLIDGAINIQPLTKKQISDYLLKVGQPANEVRNLLQRDANLWDLLNTPLMLSIFIFSATGAADISFRKDKTLSERRNRLFNTYISSMLNRRGKSIKYKNNFTLKRLCWLAKELIKHKQTQFYIEQLQPSYLPRRSMKHYMIFSMLTVALLAWPIIVLIGLFVSPQEFNTNFLILMGFSSLMLSTTQIAETEIKIIEKISISYDDLKVYLFNGFISGISSAIILIITLGGDNAFRTLIISVTVGLGISFIYGLLRSLSGISIENKTIPNQGIHRSARNAIGIGLVVAILAGITSTIGFGLAFNRTYGMRFGVGIAVSGMLFFGFFYGGNSVLKHYILRWLLYRNGSLPLRLVSFLDHCTERIFLRKVGGGYIFVHRLLMEHFARLTPKEIEELSK